MEERKPPRRRVIAAVVAAVAATSALVAGPSTALASGPCTVCVNNLSGTSLVVSGGARIETTGAVGVASTASKAADLSGSATVKAPDVGIAGGWVTSATSSFSIEPTHDPGFDPVAVPASSLSRGTIKTDRVVTAEPGTYTQITVSSTGVLHLQPGVYVVTGSMTASGDALIDGDGVTLILPTSQLTISGSSHVLLNNGHVSAGKLTVSGTGVLGLGGAPTGGDGWGGTGV
jgi:hypothetical protein